MKSKIFDEALQAQDPVAESLMNDAVLLGISITSYVTVMDVELVVIGGGLGGRLGESFANRVHEVAEAKVFGSRKSRWLRRRSSTTPASSVPPSCSDPMRVGQSCATNGAWHRRSAGASPTGQRSASARRGWRIH